jgi:OOP family OmpA-OmpF porin
MKRISYSALAFTTLLAFAPAGGALAETDNHDVVRDQNGQVIYNSFGNCVRTKWIVGSDACAPQVAQQTERRVRAVIAKEDRTVYFPFNQAVLTPDSKQRLNSLAKTLKSERDVKEARVFGYADRIGTTSYNEKLSKKRAEAVRGYLLSQGYVNSRVTDTRWFGESEPKTNCPDSLKRADLIACLQKDRRVEVEIDYQPEGTSGQPATHRR